MPLHQAEVASKMLWKQPLLREKYTMEDARQKIVLPLATTPSYCHVTGMRVSRKTLGISDMTVTYI